MGGSVPPAQGPLILPKGVWIKIIEWGGVTFETITYEVELQTERQFQVRWRRYGVGLPPYWEGDFSNSGVEKFHIFPTDVYLRVDLKSPDLDIGCTISRSSSK
jgi:hypothetical protein